MAYSTGNLGTSDGHKGEVITGVAAGSASYHGELKSEGRPFVGFHTLVTSSQPGLHFAFLLDVAKQSSRVTGKRFALEDGEEADVLNFFMVGAGCYRRLNWQNCAGIGQGTVNVNTPNERRDFGTWNYHWLTYYGFADRMKAFLHGRYAGQVEIKSKGREADIGFKSLALGFAYSLSSS